MRLVHQSSSTGRRVTSKSLIVCDSLSMESFQLLEIAAAVLSACKSRHVPVALVVSATQHDPIVQCLHDTNLAQSFAAVVQYADVEECQEQPQQQQRRGVPASWSAAASSLKTKLGTPWQHMLFFSADPTAVRTAQRLGMASVGVPADKGLTEKELQAGLQAYTDKLEGDRGY
eukprot:gene2638-2939_t